MKDPLNRSRKDGLTRESQGVIRTLNQVTKPDPVWGTILT